ncbi:hypothetical protein BV22DRAFT_1135892 [Leucogyrophana mollusca]|uniref:Uncharacterized protein n=1 Tax=Leucogyrophana mollusca TaxID=85980 RepID=A0ACB8AUI4_9AGAM|nr:hypothetical protein BV22DRAFT_1135892 [Leucogyrophana mollusca]
MGPGVPTDADLDQAVQDILRTADLNSVTKREIHRQLEEQFGMDLTSRKGEINSAIDRFWGKRDGFEDKCPRRSGKNKAKAGSPPPDPPDVEPAEIRQRPKRAGAGQGGHAAQLEKAGEAVAKKKVSKPRVVLPDDEPVNVMAPAPRQPKKQGLRSKYAKSASTGDSG